MEILVTGASGFMGSALVRLLETEGHAVVGFEFAHGRSHRR